MTSDDQRAASARHTSSQTITEEPESRTTVPIPVPDRRTADRRSGGRRLPASVLTPPTPPPPPHLDDYASIVGQGQLDTLRFLAKDLKGKTIKMVNSTAVGGGVAEMLNRLVPLMSELDVPTHWDVITGGNDFFEITKAFHNALHGAPYELTKAAQDIFLMYNEQNRERMQFGEEMVVIHDPQPVGLIRSRSKTPASWVWRCHIDLSNPDPKVWEFLRPLWSSTTPPFSLRSHLPGSCPFPSICFTRASIPSRRRTKNSPKQRSSKFAMTWASTAPVRS